MAGHQGSHVAMKPTSTMPAQAADASPFASWIDAIAEAPWVAVPAHDALTYWIDACQRAVLFWDVMRQRGNNYLENAAKTVPHVLKFDCELVADGRKLPRPVNYGLV